MYRGGGPRQDRVEEEEEKLAGEVLALPASLSLSPGMP